MHDIKRTKIQEIVPPCNELLKELIRLKRIVMEGREEVVGELKKRGVLDDILAYLKKEADKGDRFSLGLYNLWKYGQLPK
jgi:hypothetical protein